MSKSRSSSRRDKDDTKNPDVHLPAIGNYVFQKTVGEGNFAKVKLATHKITGAEVAVKVIDKTLLDEKKIGKLYREVRIMKMLHHPNIVKLYEVIETKHTVFLVMEYASGGELYDYLVVHGKMKEKDARAKFRQILSAVSYCHKKRVIHRDLKAENLLLDHNLDIKIADFGFSNYFDPESKLDTFCGSPPYAAPELFQGRKYTGPEVDIWSLGVILYVLTTGCLPFDGKNLLEMRESVCRGKYRIPFFLTDNCEKLLKKFLVRDPVKRSSLEILIDDTWINESYNDSPISTDQSEQVEEDESIIAIMEAKYKFEKSAILQALRENIYNEISAIYFLLYYDKETKIKESKTSSSDITKISNPNPKKESITAAEKEKAMPKIGEDEVLVEEPQEETAGKADANIPNTSPEKSNGAAPVAGGRRKRAATVTYDSGAGAASHAVAQSEKPKLSAGTSIKSNDKPSSSINTSEAHRESIETASSATTAQPSRDVTIKRHNTITGMLLGITARKGSEANSDSIAEEDGTEKPRSLRFTFNSNTTSSKAPDEIMVELIKVSNKLNLTHRLLTRYLLECTSTNAAAGKEILKIEVEVCKLPRLNNLHGLRFKRVSGSSADYKEICEQLLTSINL